MNYQNLYASAETLRDKYTAQIEGIEQNQKEIKEALHSINELQEYYEYWKNLTPEINKMYTQELTDVVQAKEMLEKANKDLESIRDTLLNRRLKVQKAMIIMHRNMLQAELEEKKRIQARLEARLKQIHESERGYLNKWGLVG